jgi:GntR family transcriptional regulator
MGFEYTPPKYARVIGELQRRIDSGEYAPGSLLPSEHQLAGEFAVARPTVVRALRVLRQEGWIETEQGKGSFVRGRPVLAGLVAARRGQVELDRDEAGESGELVSAGLVVPPARVAGLAGVAAGARMVCRRRLVRADGEVSELVTWWVPAELAEGTALADSAPLPGGVRSHLARRKGTRVDHVVEQVTARHPAAHEIKLLGIGRTAPVLALYVSARTASGQPVLVLEVAMPGDRHELEDAYQVS